MKNSILRQLLGIATYCALYSAQAQSPGVVAPYTNDDATVLLDHFEGSTIASLLAYAASGEPCGSPAPWATPGDSFGPGPQGLDLALTLAGSGDSTPPPIIRSYLKYPGELLTQTNGTLECWVYLSNYVFSIHQLDYVGECQGDVGGVTVDEAGHLVGDVWYTAFDTFHFDSGTTAIPLNTWTHVALSWGESGAKLYINGVFVGSHSNTGGFSSWFGLDSVFVFLGPGNYIDELRISNMQRSEFNVPSTLSPPPSIQSVHMYAGLTITGAINSVCTIESSPILGSGATWTTLTNFTLSASPYVFIDVDSPAFPHRFYRVVAGP